MSPTNTRAVAFFCYILDPSDTGMWIGGPISTIVVESWRAHGAGVGPRRAVVCSLVYIRCRLDASPNSRGIVNTECPGRHRRGVVGSGRVCLLKCFVGTQAGVIQSCRILCCSAELENSLRSTARIVMILTFSKPDVLVFQIAGST